MKPRLFDVNVDENMKILAQLIQQKYKTTIECKINPRKKEIIDISVLNMYLLTPEFINDRTNDKAIAFFKTFDVDISYPKKSVESNVYVESVIHVHKKDLNQMIKKLGGQPEIKVDPNVTQRRRGW